MMPQIALNDFNWFVEYTVWLNTLHCSFLGHVWSFWACLREISWFLLHKRSQLIKSGENCNFETCFLSTKFSFWSKIDLNPFMRLFEVNENVKNSKSVLTRGPTTVLRGSSECLPLDQCYRCQNKTNFDLKDLWNSCENPVCMIIRVLREPFQSFEYQL